MGISASVKALVGKIILNFIVLLTFPFVVANVSHLWIRDILALYNLHYLLCFSIYEIVITRPVLPISEKEFLNSI